MRWWVVVLWFSVVAFASSEAAAICGNGVIDYPEACDDGASNGSDGCCSAGCEIVGQSDTCAALERCDDDTLAFGIDGTRASLSLYGLSSPKRVGELRFEGVATAPPGPLSLDADGLQITVGGEFFYTLVFGATVPGGPRWQPLAAGGWSYRDPAGEVGGVTRITVKPVGRDRGMLQIAVRARVSDLVDHFTGLPLSAVDLENWASLVVRLRAHPHDANHGPTCGEAFFRTRSSPWQCTYDQTQHHAACTLPPGLRSCRSRDVDGAVRCSVEDAAHGEEIYYASHGEYLTGRCDQLPGVVLPPLMNCMLLGGNINFIALANWPLEHYLTGCTWDSAVDFGTTPTVHCF